MAGCTVPGTRLASSSREGGLSITSITAAAASSSSSSSAEEIEAESSLAVARRNTAKKTRTWVIWETTPKMKASPLRVGRGGCVTILHRAEKRLASVCVGCGAQIRDPFILRVSPDLEWHASCLKCAECAQYLDETCTCFVRDGKTYCKRDYVRVGSGST
ncbi:LIM/homeobox protein Lhx9-like [Lampetra planeri]